MSKGLHHSPEVWDMRSHYSNNTVGKRSSPSNSESDRSSSGKSNETAPTSYSSSPPKRPVHVHYIRDDRNRALPEPFFDDRYPQESPRSSVETYASSANDEQELPEDYPQYDVPEYTASPYEPTAIPATPSDFSALFPSTRRLAIRHDDSTLDGNMNLRLDTDVSIQGQTCDMTLYHLRMHDLKNREFSLRRYCRDSGREVCHSSRKPASAKRPPLQRSLSNALNSVRPKYASRRSTNQNVATLKRFDSGYGSTHSMDFSEGDQRPSSGNGGGAEVQPPTDDIKLDFSNYAQTTVKRTGSKGNKRYEFEYWGVQYAWKRASHNSRNSSEGSFHLTRLGGDKALAYIVPVSLRPRQAQEERSKGGWIPPCSMWIADENIVRNTAQKDLPDVIVASGLMALVDDSIRARFHSKTEKQLLVPLPKMEYIGPKRLINEMFGRKDSSSSIQSWPSSSSRPSTGVTTNKSRPTGSVRQPSYDC